MAQARRGAGFASAVIAAAMLAATTGACRPSHAAEAGFWFEKVTFRSAVVGGELTPADLAIIERVARDELTAAFAGLPIVIGDRRDATFRIRVIQEVRDRRLRANWGVAGESIAVPGLGGQGSVSFFFLASGAVATAPDTMPREQIVQAIGRGIGRTAVHELTHQLLPQAPIHDSTDIRSYEYDSAVRNAQYFGEMHWSLARPLLEQRLSR